MVDITINNQQQLLQTITAPKSISGLKIPGLQNALKKDLPPYQIIELPSKGWYYNQQSPLSSGTIMLKLPTAKEQDILTSRNLIQNNIVLEQFLRAIILTPGVDVNDLLTGDMNYLLYAARILTYGKQLKKQLVCECKARETKNIDLSQFKPKELQFEQSHKGNRQFQYTLPFSNINIIIQLPDGHLQKRITEQVQKLKKISKDKIDKTLTTRYKYIIVQVDGVRDPKRIRQFVDKELSTRDSLALRKFLYKVNPNIDISYTYKCQECGKQQEEQVSIDIQFFWPAN